MTGTEVLRVRVAGLPAMQGSKKIIPAIVTKAGKLVPARLVDASPEKLKAWRKTVTQAARAALPEDHQPIAGPCRAVLLFAMPRPASAPKTRRVWPSGQVGDVDKLARAVLDALTDAGVYRDDCQVVDLRAVKDYPGAVVEQTTPGVLIAVHRVEHHGPPAALTPDQEGLPLS